MWIALVLAGLVEVAAAGDRRARLNEIVNRLGLRAPPEGLEPREVPTSVLLDRLRDRYGREVYTMLRVVYVGAGFLPPQEEQWERRSHPGDFLMPWVAREMEGWEHPVARGVIGRWVLHLSGIVDWVRATGVDPFVYDFDEAVIAQVRWHQGFGRAGFRGPVKLRKGDQVFHTFPDGAVLVNVNARKSLEVESDSMGHCVGTYWPQVSSGESIILSYRDAQGVPWVTIEEEPDTGRIVQFLGPRNHTPATMEDFVDEIGGTEVEARQAWLRAAWFLATTRDPTPALTRMLGTSPTMETEVASAIRAVFSNSVVMERLDSAVGSLQALVDERKWPSGRTSVGSQSVAMHFGRPLDPGGYAGSEVFWDALDVVESDMDAALPGSRFRGWGVHSKADVDVFDHGGLVVSTGLMLQTLDTLPISQVWFAIRVSEGGGDVPRGMAWEVHVPSMKEVPYPFRGRSWLEIFEDLVSKGVIAVGTLAEYGEALERLAAHLGVPWP